MRIFAAAAVAAAICLPAAADETPKIDPERRALLISIIEDLGCTVNGASPPKPFLDAMEEHKFVKEETNAIAGQLFEEGAAKRDGPNLILKTGKCS